MKAVGSALWSRIAARSVTELIRLACVLALLGLAVMIYPLLVPGARMGGVGNRETEIEDLRSTVSRDEDVRRLEIAVHDAAFVRGRESARELNSEDQRTARREGLIPTNPCRRSARHRRQIDGELGPGMD